MRLLYLLALASLPCTAIADRRDSLLQEQEDTLPTIIVKAQTRPAVIDAIDKSMKARAQPHTPSLGEMLNKRFPNLMDCILHPFAFKARKRERRRKRHERILRDYDRIATPDELLRAAIKREQERKQERQHNQ